MEDYDLETLVNLLDEYMREHIEDGDDEKHIQFSHISNDIQATLDDM